MKKTIVGKCCICLEERELTFDHVPPKSALNRGPFWPIDPQKSLTMTKEERVSYRGRKDQRGTGRYSLCRDCNSMLGSRYVKAYSHLVRDVATILFQRAIDESERIGPFLVRTRPLNLVKSICGMVLSISEPDQDLWLDKMRAFILDRELRLLPSGIRVFLYASRSSMVRQVSQFAALNILSGPVTYSDLYSLPLGAVVTYGSGPLDIRHTEITHFGTFGYDEETEIALTVPIFGVDGALSVF